MRPQTPASYATALGYFTISSCQKSINTQKRFSIWARGPWHCAIHGKFDPGYCITFTKWLDDGLRQWHKKGGGSGGGGTGPPAWFQSVEISGNSMLFRQYCIKILGSFILFGQVCFKILGNLIFIKPCQFQWRPFFFFFGGHLNLDRITDRFSGKIQCHFLGKSLMPPQILLSPMAWGSKFWDKTP